MRLFFNMETCNKHRTPFPMIYLNSKTCFQILTFIDQSLAIKMAMHSQDHNDKLVATYVEREMGSFSNASGASRNVQCAIRHKSISRSTGASYHTTTI